MIKQGNKPNPSYMHRISGKKVYPYDTTRVPPDKRLVLRNPDKLINGVCVIRSKLEEKFALWCDRCTNVIAWSSESMYVTYYDPLSRRTRRYYPDFCVTVIDKNGDKRDYLVEIKMARETKVPKLSMGKHPNKYRKEKALFEKNMAKWNAAAHYCRQNGAEFKLVTENMLDKLGDRI